MQVRDLLAEDAAVSPVIGVILMVAITVILAAVIGTFVLGIGGDTTNPPKASFDFEYNASAAGGNGALAVNHTGGDSFTPENTGQAGTCGSDGLAVTGAGLSDCWQLSSGSGGDLSAGDGVRVTGVTAGETVRVVWAAPGGGESQTVAAFQVPA